MDKTYCISIQNLYENKKYYLDNGYYVEHTAEENEDGSIYEDYYDLYARNNEMVCSDGEECELIKKDKKGYYFHSINDTNLDSFFILTEEEFGIATMAFDVKED